jgi:hypothetical protein
MTKLFQRPLIVGASVSANYGTSSPGRRLSLRHTSADAIVTVAQGGAPGREIIPRITDKILEDRTVIIGMDLFFWDSTASQAAPSLKLMEQIIKKAYDADIPFVLGDIPELLVGQQPHRNALNKRIHELCRADRDCFVLKLDDLHQQVLRDGYLTIDGKRYTLRQLVPDGLHLSDVAADFLADKIKESIGILNALFR